MIPRLSQVRERVDGMSNSEAQAKGRHWPLDLIQLYSTISHPCQPSSSKSSQPLKLLLHLSNPPIDKLMMPNTIEICKTHWLNQVKEADFVRWRNTNKVTSLRRVDLEAGWDGIVQGNSASPLQFGSENGC